MEIDELLEIDPNDPEQRLADQLVENDAHLLEQLIRVRRDRMTQADVARAMGVSESSVSKIESGTRDLRMSTVRRYAHAVGVLVEHEVNPHWDGSSAHDAPHRPVVWSQEASSPIAEYMQSLLPALVDMVGPERVLTDRQLGLQIWKKANK